MDNRVKTSIRVDRIRRLVYAGMSAAASFVIVWRVAGLLIGNPADAAIILGCVAVWAVLRLDIATMGHHND